MPIGSAIGAVGSYMSAKTVSAASAKAARETNEYNRENYKHRYQWQVDDMRKAGLNPALSYTTGAGTPTGGVQQTEFGGSQYNEASKQLGSVMSKATTQALQREQVSNAKNMNEQISAQTDQIKSQTNIQNSKLLEEILNMQSSTAKNWADVKYGSTYKLGGNIIENIVENIKNNTTTSKDGWQSNGGYKPYQLKRKDIDENSPWIKNRVEQMNYERKNK